MALTLKQKRFADEYIISGNATEAARKAGYKKDVCGRENLRKTTIRQYIDERLAEKEDKVIAKQDEVLKYLTSVLRGESKSEIVIIEGLGDGISEARRVNKCPDEKERLRAAELLGKRYGLYVDKQELDADMNLTVQVDYGPEDPK